MRRGVMASLVGDTGEVIDPAPTSGALSASPLSATPGARVVAGPDLTARQLHDLLRLRIDVFIVEQECTYHELDGRDLLASTEHLWAEDADGVFVALRILADPDGRRIGRVVTRNDRRGVGLARQLLEWAHDQTGSASTVLDAQSHLRGFYERFGYEVVGPEFDDEGIPHLPMRRTPPTRTQ